VTTPTNERAQVDEAVDRLLAEHDPVTTPTTVLRGARYDAGLAWVHFPVAFGGLGVHRDLNEHVENRLDEAGAPEADTSLFFFMHLAGPTILTHGTEEQKQRYLRPMFTGEERWCQLFSEPGAGSDVAGLATRAVRDGDEWIINGQKVWNTLAHLADLGLLVTRSDPDLPKHEGMTYFIVNMHAPGVEVRPLRQITGEAEFNEVYLTDVRIADADRLGAAGQGWRVTLTSLMNERQAIAAYSSHISDLQRGGAANDAVTIWHGLEEWQRTPAHKSELMRLWVRGEVGRLTTLRAAEAVRAGNPGPEMSVAKLEFAEYNKALYSFCLDLLGANGTVGFDYTLRRPKVMDPTGRAQGVHHAFLRVRANSIEGGTSEIMRNIIAEQVLGLPGEPRVDKGIPWSQIRRN
jgi:alkylation response protein AidB-like acyl-CoA dehydrogenase